MRPPSFPLHTPPRGSHPLGGTIFAGVLQLLKGKKTTKAMLEDSATELARALLEAMNLVKVFNDRFIVADDFLPEHPEREKMVQYLVARSWRGTEIAACGAAGIPRSKLEEWRKYEDFKRWEKYAEEACTDLVEEMALMQAYLHGDKDLIKTVLKAKREGYSDRIEHTGKGGGPIEIVTSIPRPQRLE